MLLNLVILADAAPPSSASADLGTKLSPFYFQTDFWINIVIGLAGLGVGIAALVWAVRAYDEAAAAKTEATAAKTAAVKAGEIVRMRSIVIDLSEINQLLGRLEDDLSFTEARDMLNTASTHLHRDLSYLRTDADLAPEIESLFNLLIDASKALAGVRPQAGVSLAPEATYNAMEGQFFKISAKVADIMGILERKAATQP